MRKPANLQDYVGNSPKKKSRKKFKQTGLKGHKENKKMENAIVINNMKFSNVKKAWKYARRKGLIRWNNSYGLGGRDEFKVAKSTITGAYVNHKLYELNIGTFKLCGFEACRALGEIK